ncbi:hypothetical protein [Micromonospora taraxaci]|uniref:hypothetical protein n=1 Tax=Micromonospora taraxaci TaxID=1316803 RepID=UPI0033B484E8
MAKGTNFDTVEHARRLAQALREQAARDAAVRAEHERRARDIARVQAEEYRNR